MLAKTNDMDDREEVKALLNGLQAQLPTLEELLARCSDHWGYEDPVYRCAFLSRDGDQVWQGTASAAGHSAEWLRGAAVSLQSTLMTPLQMPTNRAIPALLLGIV